MSFSRDPEQFELHHVRQMAGLAGKRVLEIGAGAGRLTFQYAAETAHTVGVDTNYDDIMTAGDRRDPHARFAVAQGQALPFRDGSFDVVVFTSSL